jgi:hypothetical protein
MERDSKDPRRALEPAQPDRQTPPSGHDAIKPPLASEGLERVRESHT